MLILSLQHRYLKEGDHVLGGPGEFLAEVLLLGGDADGAVVRVADARHDAALRDHGDRSEPCIRFYPAEEKHTGEQKKAALSADCICPGVCLRKRDREGLNACVRPRRNVCRKRLDERRGIEHTTPRRNLGTKKVPMLHLPVILLV